MFSQEDAAFRPPIDALRQWANALAAAINQRKATMEQLEAANATDTERLKALATLLPSGEAPLLMSNDDAQARGAQHGALAGLSPTKALRALLRAKPNTWFGPAEALHEMQQQGFTTKARQPSGLIRCLLHRLAAKGEAEVDGQKRNRKYRMKQEQQEAAGLVPQPPLVQDARP